MIRNPRPGVDIAGPRGSGKGRLAAALGILGLSATAAWAGAFPLGTLYYSTAEAPRDYRGPQPGLLLALNDSTAAMPRERDLLDRAVAPARAPEGETGTPAPRPQAAPDAAAAVPRVASSAGMALPQGATIPHASAPAPAAPGSAGEAAVDPIARAKQSIAECQARFAQVQDYVCTFYKRERINGRLTQPHVMSMKWRARPNSVYFKFQRPNKGREAIYVAGRNGGKVVAHDVGIGKLVAGTMRLDPRGSMAMEENRHPVTEAGIGSLVDTVARHWAVELTPQESRMAFYPNMRVGNHPCTVIESVHPRKRPDFLFYMVKLYIDHEHGLPIRFEAYDWPKHPGAAPELVEEYTYMNLRTNVGLREHDFDPSNPQYSYGRL